MWFNLLILIKWNCPCATIHAAIFANCSTEIKFTIINQVLLLRIIISHSSGNSFIVVTQKQYKSKNINQLNNKNK